MGNLGRWSRISRIIVYAGVSHDIMEEFKYSWSSAYKNYMKRDLLLDIIPFRINGDRLYYRIMDLNDTYIVVKLRNANHVRDNYIYQKPITIEEHINYYHTQIETGNIVQYIMLTRKTNKIIGCVFLKNIDLEAKWAEYGVFIGDSKELGKGYGAKITYITGSFIQCNCHKNIYRCGIC